MQSLQSKEAIEQRNIAGLASEFSLPLAEVSILYEAQRPRLMKGAKRCQLNGLAAYGVGLDG